MLCENCGKESRVIYLKLDSGFICPDCEELSRKKDKGPIWEIICERMKKKYGRYK